MVLPLAFLRFLACKEEPAGLSSVTTPTEPAAWTPERACGALRLFVRAGERGLALEVRTDIAAAVLAEIELDQRVDLAVDPARGVVEDGMTESMVCGSVEDFPPGQNDSHWQLTAGTVRFVFTPVEGLETEDNAWSYDGTVVGTVHVELRDLILTPMEGAGAAEVPDMDFDLPLTNPDLPA